MTTPIKNDKMLQNCNNEPIWIFTLQKHQVEGVLDLARSMHQESPIYRKFPFNDAVFRGWLTAAVNQPEKFFCSVAKQDGNIIGAMLGVTMNMLFSDSKMASELGVFVKPENRGTRAGLKLVKSFETWAEKQGCSLITVGVSAGITDERAVKFYEKLGFEKHGVALRREIS